MTTIAAHLITAEEFEKKYADVPFCELVRGEVIQLTAGGFRHSRITMRAAKLLDIWADGSRLGRVVTGDAGLIVEREPDTVRGADVAYFSYHRLPADREPTGFSKVPPELVIEVVGKGQGWNAMLEKTAEYLAMGVDRVWLLAPDSETLHTFGGDTKPRELSADDEVRDDSILPGLACRVWQFFHDSKPATA